MIPEQNIYIFCMLPIKNKGSKIRLVYVRVPGTWCRVFFFNIRLLYVIHGAY